MTATAADFAVLRVTTSPSLVAGRDAATVEF
jgi:hypothetical protein